MTFHKQGNNNGAVREKNNLKSHCCWSLTQRDNINLSLSDLSVS